MGGRAGCRAIVLAVMVTSGFAGLGYQIVWTQQCALWLGHDAAAVLAVIAAFFGGLALGAVVFGRRIESTGHPVLAYAVCEFTIGLWAAALLLLMSPLSDAMLRLVGPEPSPLWQWTVYFSGTFLLLLPATAAMGASLPLMERIITGVSDGARSIAALYAANTLGAFVGVLCCAFWLVPAYGLRQTAEWCAALNLMAGAVGLLTLRDPQASATTLNAAPPAKHAAGGVLMRLALTGLLGIGYEVLVVRVLSEVTENSVYTYAALLAVYLAGTAAGAALYQRVGRRGEVPRRCDSLLCALSLACLFSGAALWSAERVYAVVRSLLGAGMPGAIGSEAALAMMAFAAPTMLMGALFSNLCARAAAAELGFGRALAANTLGAALAPALVGVVALPFMGAKNVLLLIACGYAVLGTYEAAMWGRMLVPATVAMAMMVTFPSLAFIDTPPGGRLVSYLEGTTASVSVVEDATGAAVLRINNRQQEGSSATLYVDGRQGWLPILLHPDPHAVLFLGLGTGLTSAAAAMDPAVEVDAVELLPEVIITSEHFRRRLAQQLSRPVRVVRADARRFVREGGHRYDVIVADNFHPARSGSGSLYTVEHFAAVRKRLQPEGVFCQWLPLHQLDLDTLRSIVRSFVQVYPQGAALIASNSLRTPVIGLIARANDGRFDAAALRRRLASRQQQLAGFGIEDAFALLGSFIAGPTALRRFAGDAPLNTDDHPVVMYRAPRVTYAPDSTPAERLLQLVGQLSVSPSEIMQPDTDVAWAQRLDAYWQARNRFLAAGRQVQAGGEVQDMLAQVRLPLLDVLHISPDFRSAYDPLLQMADALSRTDMEAARMLLAELIAAQPERGEASALLESLAAPR